MKLNLSKLLVGTTTALRNITRYSNSPRVHNENVAEHSFYVALVCFYLCQNLNHSVKRYVVDTDKALRKAILHDLDECISGDFVRPFKLSSEELYNAIEKGIEKQLPKLFDEVFKDLPGKLKRSWTATWKNARSGDTLEGDIVAFADFLSVLSYVLSEYRLGNIAILEHIKDLDLYLESFRERKFYQFDIVKYWYREAARITYMLLSKDKRF